MGEVNRRGKAELRGIWAYLAEKHPDRFTCPSGIDVQRLSRWLVKNPMPEEPNPWFDYLKPRRQIYHLGEPRHYSDHEMAHFEKGIQEVTHPLFVLHCEGKSQMRKELRRAKRSRKFRKSLKRRSALAGCNTPV